MKDAHAGASAGTVRALPLPQLSDAELVHALISREPRAAEQLWERFSSLSRGLLVGSVGPVPEVDDLLQESFIRVFRKIAELRDPSLLRSFVVGITIRVAKEELRRRRVRRWFLLTETQDLDAMEATSVDHQGRAALSRVHAILSKLDDELRLAFVLRFVEGMSPPDVADALGCSLATAKRRITRAQERVLVHARAEPDLIAYLGEGSSDWQPGSSDAPPASVNRQIGSSAPGAHAGNQEAGDD